MPSSMATVHLQQQMHHLVQGTAAMRLLACLLVVVPLASLSSAQPTNSLAGRPPIVINDQVLPDQTFAISTFLQVAAGSSAREGYTDFDLINFLVNTECLEAEFDSIAAFGIHLDPALLAGGPEPLNGRRARISPKLLPFAQETARDEAGHVRFIREALGELASPCPLIDIGAFGPFFGNAMRRYGMKCDNSFDPFKNDVNLFLAIWSLEEIGSTGDKGVSGLCENPTLRDGAAGLAVSAGYQAAAQRFILWERQGEIVEPFGVNVTVVMQAISDYRDYLDGPAQVDQGLYFDGGINIVPTDGNGLTYSRTPQQVLSILTFGAEDGRGGFFPKGVNGRINLPNILGPKYGSTRPGTDYPFYDATGFQAPETTKRGEPLPGRDEKPQYTLGVPPGVEPFATVAYPGTPGCPIPPPPPTRGYPCDATGDDNSGSGNGTRG